MTGILNQSVAENDDLGAALSLESPDPLHWAIINAWKVEPQSDDRVPVCGNVDPSIAPPSVRRSSARRKHQAMFKEWSQGRHE